jgi:hypothetical protein
MKLKEKIKQINLFHLNQKIKRQNSTIMRQQIIIKDDVPSQNAANQFHPLDHL